MDVALNGALVYCSYSPFVGHRLNVCDEVLVKISCCFKSKNWPTISVNRGCIFMYVYMYLFKSDVWLTVHRNSVWIRKTN